MIDVVASLTQSAKADPLLLLTTVNGFYDQAFNKLLAVTFGLIAFIGLFVPIAVAWVQVRTLRAEKNSLLKDLRTDIDSEKQAIRDEISNLISAEAQKIREEYETRLEDLKRELSRSSAAAEARAFHLQGNGCKQRSKFAAALKDFSVAVPLYLQANDEANAQRCLRSLVEECLPKMSSASYENMNVEALCNTLIEELKSVNTNRRYDNDIQRIERACKAASKRKPAEAATA